MLYRITAERKYQPPVTTQLLISSYFLLHVSVFEQNYHQIIKKYTARIFSCGRDSSVDIAARYRLDSPGSNSAGGGGAGFAHPFRPALWLTQPSTQGVHVVLLEVK